MYPLKETNNSDYETRTKKNIVDSDGTLILHHKELGGGTLLTSDYAKEIEKPLLVIKIHSDGTSEYLPQIITWIIQNSISMLNVASPRRSEWNNGYHLTKQLISSLIYQIKKSQGETSTF